MLLSGHEIRSSSSVDGLGRGIAVIPVVLLAQQPTFKAGTQIVPLYVTVIDVDKRLVPDLAKEDFEVFDNGKPVTLTLFQNEPEPFSVRRHARHERQHDADRSTC